MAQQAPSVDLWPCWTRLDPAWKFIAQPNGTPFYYNAGTRQRSHSKPPFHFMSKTDIPAGSTVHIESPYEDRQVLRLSFPQGCAGNQWFAVPVDSSGGAGGAPSTNAAELAEQRRQVRAESPFLPCSVLGHTGTAVSRTGQAAEQARLQQLQQQQLAEERERQRAEQLEYAMDNPDSDLQNAADVEIFETYMPQKLRYGRPHPDPVVQAACLSAVESPDVSLTLRMQEQGHAAASALSALQLEAVTYACQVRGFGGAQPTHINPSRGYPVFFRLAPRLTRCVPAALPRAAARRLPRRLFHQRRRGDGKRPRNHRCVRARVCDSACVTVCAADDPVPLPCAGLLVEEMLHGRSKSLWVSISADLKIDAERDLRDCVSQSSRGGGHSVGGRGGVRQGCHPPHTHSHTSVWPVSGQGVKMAGEDSEDSEDEDGVGEKDSAGASSSSLEVVALNKCPYGKLKLGERTILFATYSSLVSRKMAKGGRKRRAGKNSSRLEQIINWLVGRPFDPDPPFDVAVSPGIHLCDVCSCHEMREKRKSRVRTSTAPSSSTSATSPRT
jgi:hypothetical protein